MLSAFRFAKVRAISWLCEVVASRRPATEIGLRELDQTNSWNRLKQFARVIAHPEAVHEMTRVVPGDGASQLAELRHPLEQQRTEVANLRLNIARILGRRGIAFEDRAVLRDRGRTSRSCRYDRIWCEALECANIFPRERSCALAVARVEIQRSAANRILHRQYAISSRPQKPLTVGVLRIR